MAINIAADPFIVTLSPSYAHGTFSSYPAAVRDTKLDQVFYADPFEITLSIPGNWIGIGIVADLFIVTLSIYGEPIDSVFISADPFVINTKILGDGYVSRARRNWVKWTDVGYLDFTLKEKNVAGESPLNWNGFVYKLIKLEGKIIAYGQGGVTILTPSNEVYGRQDIYPLGLLGRSAACGTDFEHFFIDSYGRLYKLSHEGIQKLGYSEFLSSMINPVMTLDTEKNLLYICDGVNGYIFNTKDYSFGIGPSNITGMGIVGNTKYVVSDGTISTPKFEVCTDIYDMGSRKGKTIHNIELATDITEHLELQVEYKLNNTDIFSKSMWHLVNPSGICYCPCYGVDFRFRIRSYIYEFFEIDRLKINGSIHGISYRDYLSMLKQNM
jgi:hypothetical protein